MSTACIPFRPAENTRVLGVVPFKGDKTGSRVVVNLQIMDLVRTNSSTLRAVADILLTPIGLQLFAVPIFVKDGRVTFAPSRRDIPKKSNEEEFEFTFGFAARAHRDIFKDQLLGELSTYCLKHHNQSLEEFLEVDNDLLSAPGQGRPNRTDQTYGPFPNGGVHGSRYMTPTRRRMPGQA